MSGELYKHTYHNIVVILVLKYYYIFLQAFINYYTIEELRGFVASALEMQPSLSLTLARGPTTPDPSRHPPAGGPTQTWCICTYCRYEENPIERVCCGNLPHKCVSLLPPMERVVMDPMSIDINNRYRRDIFSQDEEINPKYYRHGGYRTFTLWVHGRLGEGNRRVVPSCCAWKIRDKFPSPNGDYVRFKAARTD